MIPIGQIMNDVLAGGVGGTVGTILNTPMDVVKVWWMSLELPAFE